MSGLTSRQIVLARRPAGMPSVDHFEQVERAVPSPGQGEVLCRTLWLSLDPYMRGRMNAGASYAPSVELGQVMVGATVSEVLESKDPALAPGDVVLGYDGWQTHAVARAAGLRKLDPALAPVSTALGVLGMPGLTAWVGLFDIGRPKPGETVVVAAAAGAVGSAVGQMARLRGCRAVGIAGGAAKCRHVVEDLGFDACVDYQVPGFAEALRAACPGGIDVYFENVGGAVLEAVVPLLNTFGRVPVCGLIAQYNLPALPAGPNWAAILVKRLRVEGFIVRDHAARFPPFLAEAGPWVREGRLRYREDVVEGLDQAPAAFLGLFAGNNLGKLVVRVAA